MSDTDPIEGFIAKWSQSSGAERANYALFLTDLCDTLGVPRPDPTVADESQNTYVLEKAVTFKHADGTTSTGRIDLYRRGCFVCETKQGVETRRTPAESDLATVTTARRGHGVRGTKAWDDAMIAARGQAEQYVRAIPDDNPPFIVVMDVGYSIELYADFSRLGKVYTPFPDAQNHRLKLESLRDDKVRERLRALWLDPLSLDPSRRSAKVTRQIADKLAKLAKSLESKDHHPEVVAHFLMRCLFTLFAEDVKLIKNNAFTDLLNSLKGNAHNLKHTLPHVWREMDKGTEYSPVLKQKLLKFNGGLFEETTALDLNEEQLAILTDAARADWHDVEPAIFGTLLERALDPTERHKLGAHYTPRAYVERLVLPTIIEPLREDWDAARTASLALANAGKTDAAVAEAKAFLDKLCNTIVLDPACGTGNFLYVAMHRMKALEGEVRDWLTQLGETQAEFEIKGQTVDPHQFLGIEINPRAAAIADLVLWIGYLQWHFQTYGNTNPPEPVLKAFHNIENRDAVLAYDAKELVTDDEGKPVTRWDGRTMKKSPVTGEDIPDESARTPVYRYTNPRKAEWPKADFVVGNPPFIGNKRMRFALSDAYVDAIHTAMPELPATIDFVMYWWQHAADLAAFKALRRFGFITTNSITQPFNRVVVEAHLTRPDGCRISFAIPDHPWTDAEDGAAVRIAMTAADASRASGVLAFVQSEQEGDDGSSDVTLTSMVGEIHADLTTGVTVTNAVELQANARLSGQGVIVLGEGFLLKTDEATELLSREPSAAKFIKQYRNGKDLTDKPRGLRIIDLHGMNEADVRQFPAVYQRIYDRVRPIRLEMKDKARREKWWLFGRSNSEIRAALATLPRYIATCRTAKHRVFMFLDAHILPDAKIVAIGADDAYALGVLSSTLHVKWSLKTGAFLEDRPNYNHADCFNKFPFPAASDVQKQVIRSLGEQLDAHRKRQQALHPGLTITDMYNVLERLRAGEALTDKEKRIHEQGLVSVLKQIHDDLDAAVFEAYGWPADLSDEQILERLVALNHERAAEEKRGIVRWLRPEFQNQGRETQLELVEGASDKRTKSKPADKTQAKKPAKQAWPKTLPEQAKAVRGVLTSAETGLSVAEVAKRFTRPNADQIRTLLDTLVSLGQARADGDRYRA